MSAWRSAGAAATRSCSAASANARFAALFARSTARTTATPSETPACAVRLPAMTQQVAQSGAPELRMGQQLHAGTEIRPSRSCTTWSAASATVALWVTMTIVVPCSLPAGSQRRSPRSWWLRRGCRSARPPTARRVRAPVADGDALLLAAGKGVGKRLPAWGSPQTAGFRATATASAERLTSSIGRARFSPTVRVGIRLKN